MKQFIQNFFNMSFIQGYYSHFPLCLKNCIQNLVEQNLQ